MHDVANGIWHITEQKVKKDECVAAVKCWRLNLVIAACFTEITTDEEWSGKNTKAQDFALLLEIKSMAFQLEIGITLCPEPVSAFQGITADISTCKFSRNILVRCAANASSIRQQKKIIRMEFELIHEWLLGLSESYNVNPYIFGGIYVGAIPFFTLSVAWIIRNKKREKSITLPVISTGFFLSSAYIYLMIAGENVPVWVYILIVGLLGYGVYSTFNKIKNTQRGTTKL